MIISQLMLGVFHSTCRSSLNHALYVDSAGPWQRGHKPTLKLTQSGTFCFFDQNSLVALKQLLSGKRHLLADANRP